MPLLFVTLNCLILLPQPVVHLPELSFDGAVLHKPEHRVDHKEESKVAEGAGQAVGHPPHQPGDRKGNDTAECKMAQCHFQKAPVFHIPDDEGGVIESAVDHAENGLQQDGVYLTAAQSDEIMGNCVVGSVSDKE